MEKYWTKEKANEAKLLDCYLLEMMRYKDDIEETEQNLIAKGLYKIKIYHMDDDEFRPKVYPMNYLDMARYYWFTRKWFRIM